MNVSGNSTFLYEGTNMVNSCLKSGGGRVLPLTSRETDTAFFASSAFFSQDSSDDASVRVLTLFGPLCVVSPLYAVVVNLLFADLLATNRFEVLGGLVEWEAADAVIMAVRPFDPDSSSSGK